MLQKKKDLPQLTRAEEAVMQALWNCGPTVLVREIIAAMPEPKPHANTVNTVLKILVEKGFVACEPLGHANVYRALVSKESFSSRTIARVVKRYFNGSFADMVSSFAAEKDIDLAELEAVIKSLKKKQ